jgi:hypothetical protein
VLRRVGLNTRAKRLALIARHRDPYERKPDMPPPERHIDASEPGEKVQLDCFYVGRLSGTKGTVWQYTAIDVASVFCWAELHTSQRNPRSRHTRELVHRVAAELAAAGWKLREVTTDNGSEFLAKAFGATVARLGARQRFIRELQRLRRTRPAHHPRGMLAAGVRTLTNPQDDRARPRPPGLPRPVQLRSRPHRATHTRARARKHRLRRAQDDHREMTTCRYISGLGRG